ncbi:hypothetical protein QBC43DRAFT_302973 [Cladorrhinum sp. PSN259]|nr:hypothetical protein QBC43DRAFT_302973 [Cladorrhinum sp. PSN259]
MGGNPSPGGGVPLRNHNNSTNGARYTRPIGSATGRDGSDTNLAAGNGPQAAALNATQVVNSYQRNGPHVSNIGRFVNNNWRRNANKQPIHEAQSQGQQKGFGVAPELTPAHASTDWRTQRQPTTESVQSSLSFPYLGSSGMAMPFMGGGVQTVQPVHPANYYLNSQFGVQTGQYFPQPAGQNYGTLINAAVAGTPVQHDGNQPFTGAGGAIYNQTVPKSFTFGGSIPNVPPPAFPLSTLTRARAGTMQSVAASDPFTSPQHRGSISSQGSQELVAGVTAVKLPNRSELQSRQDCSVVLRGLTTDEKGQQCLPTFEEAQTAEHFPFIESCSQAAPAMHGVVGIKNIPYHLHRNELIALLGRNSRMLNDIDEGVHIVMERLTAKTLDAYVEFFTLDDAVKCVNRMREKAARGGPLKVDGRQVEVRIADQSELMRDLFPCASVQWHGARPHIQEPPEDQPWLKFKGFFSIDEMTMVAKHAEAQNRSQYSSQCPQRPYESMISTLKKMPWYMSDLITVRQRQIVYQTTVKLLTALHRSLHEPRRKHINLSQQLFNRLVKAAMLCPGFSVVQKDNIAAIADLDEARAMQFNQPLFANEWTHLHTLCPRPQPPIPIDVLDWFIAFIREETTKRLAALSLLERNDLERKASSTSDYFGYLWAELDLPQGDEFDAMTLRELAERELNTIRSILARVLPRGPSSPQALPEKA